MCITPLHQEHSFFHALHFSASRIQLLPYLHNLRLPSSGVCLYAPGLKKNAPSQMKLLFTLNVGLASAVSPLALVVTISGSASLSPCSLRSQCSNSPLRQAAPKGPASTRGLLAGGTTVGLCPAMACFKAMYMASMASSDTVAAKHADASCIHIAAFQQQTCTG